MSNYFEKFHQKMRTKRFLAMAATFSVIFCYDFPLSLFNNKLSEFSHFITSILKSLVILAIWLVLVGAIYSRITPFCALNRIFSPASETALLNHNDQSYFKACFKKQIKLQENGRQHLQLSVSGRLIFLRFRKNVIKW